MKDVVRIIKKKIQKEDGNFFVKLLALHTVGEDTKAIGVNFSAKCKEKFEKEMIKNDIEYPVDVVLEDNDYFITSNKVVDGIEEKEYFKIVILDYQNLISVDLEQWKEEHPLERKTLADLH